ncbi:Hydroxyproline-rich glycoprotein family protein isoform 2 [Hibiscus syriacus]|uniref:Hydroxyproline-rich glycoprotein family protein isoform 2 n=1 Tax=Hibiscus syriacus TaxID=106335 RepID=A0A6A2X664_HIBSY|nr:Hydroxyproline-rich glycoprotein family protein isoform 2 [Hibiscus syriacus]
MRGENSLENRAKASSKFGDQNQAPKSLHTKTISNSHESSGSHDLFIELDHVRSLLHEFKERELKLQAELTEWKTNAKERNGENLEISKEPQSNRDLEMEVVELRRLNKELQMQKRNLACKLSSLESQLASLAKSNEALLWVSRTTRTAAKPLFRGCSGVMLLQKLKSSMLRHTNENLSKQVEGLQMSRLNEVEKLAYLRWVNSCLRDELRNSYSTTNSDKPISPVQSKVEYVGSPNSASSKSSEHNFIKKMKKWSITSQEFSSTEYAENVVDKEWVHIEELRSSGRRHSIKMEAEPLTSQKPAAVAPSASLDFEKRALRIPNPPPRPSCSIPFGPKDESCTQIPPPPPPKFSVRISAGVVKRAPQVVDGMIGEIENRSSHLLAIKADVETQGEFVNSLIREVNNAIYQNIEDVVAFVKCLDDELCYLVDERAVLKNFAWTEKKANTPRSQEIGGIPNSHRLDARQWDYKQAWIAETGEEAHEKGSHGTAVQGNSGKGSVVVRLVDNVLGSQEDSTLKLCMRLRNSGTLPTSLTKSSSKGVAMELHSKASLEKDLSMDYMLLQGVRFVFRIHQFAGGFNSETMLAFEELRNLANLLNKK